MISAYAFIFFILVTAAYFSVKLGKLTVSAAITGILLSLLIYTGTGYAGVVMLAVFFILGSAATNWKINVKEEKQLAEKNKGRRKASQVFANAGVAAIAGLLIFLFPAHSDLFRVMITAAIASAIADTLSSELGMLYGRKCYNIITLKKDTRGLNGVVSLEGFSIGIAGSILISLVYGFGFGWSINLLWIVIAGTVGNIADSILGATLERRNIIGNNAVNFLNTLIAALTAEVLMKLNS